MPIKAALTGLTELREKKKDGKEDTLNQKGGMVREGSGEELEGGRGVDMIKIWIYVRTFQRRNCKIFFDNLLSIWKKLKASLFLNLQYRMKSG